MAFPIGHPIEHISGSLKSEGHFGLVTLSIRTRETPDFSANPENLQTSLKPDSDSNLRNQPIATPPFAIIELKTIR
jgi:hypothetical protein